MIRSMIIIFLILSCVSGQEPPVVDDLGPGQPIPIFQELPKASTEITINLYGLMGEINITNFDKEWLEFLNETNLTA